MSSSGFFVDPDSEFLLSSRQDPSSQKQHIYQEPSSFRPSRKEVRFDTSPNLANHSTDYTPPTNVSRNTLGSHYEHSKAQSMGSSCVDEEGMGGLTIRSVRFPEGSLHISSSMPASYQIERDSDGFDEADPWTWPKLESRRHYRASLVGNGNRKSKVHLTKSQMKSLRAIVRGPRPSAQSSDRRAKSSSPSPNWHIEREPRRHASQKLSTIIADERADPWCFPRLHESTKKQQKTKRAGSLHDTKSEAGNDLERFAFFDEEKSQQSDSEILTKPLKSSRKQRKEMDKKNMKGAKDVRTQEKAGTETRLHGRSAEREKPPTALRDHSLSASAKFHGWDMEPTSSPPPFAAEKPPSVARSGSAWGGIEDGERWGSDEQNSTSEGSKAGSKGKNRLAGTRTNSGGYTSQKQQSAAAGSTMWGKPAAGAGSERWEDAGALNLLGGSHKSDSRKTGSDGSKVSGSNDGVTSKKEAWALDPIPENGPLDTTHTSDEKRSNRRELVRYKDKDKSGSSRNESGQPHSSKKEGSKKSSARSSYHSPIVEDDPNNWQGWTVTSHKSDKPQSQSGRNDHVNEEWAASVTSSNRRESLRKSSSTRANPLDSWAAGKVPSDISYGTGYERREGSRKSSPHSFVNHRPDQGGWEASPLRSGSRKTSSNGSNNNQAQDRNWAASPVVSQQGGWASEVSPKNPDGGQVNQGMSFF